MDSLFRSTVFGMAVKRLVYVALVILLAGCLARTRSELVRGNNPRHEAARLGDPNYDVVAYAELCKSELGIEAPLPDMNCLDGVEIPVTINGQRVLDKDFPALESGRGGCDRAQWLDGECWTYDLIQRIEIQPDVEAVLNCRQKLYTSALSKEERIDAYESTVARNAPAAERVRSWRAIFEFDDLGLILRNRNTGKTCFFTFFGKLDPKDPEKSYSFYGGWIPAPDQNTLASRDEVFDRLPEPKPPEEYLERMWHRGPRGAPGGRANMFFTPAATAAGQCVSCHNHGAFKHSPYVDQAYADGERIVPSNDRDIPYFPVGDAFQKPLDDKPMLEIDTDPVDGQPQGCTVCHRLTTGSVGAQTRLDWAIGEDVPHPSYFARQFPRHAWMPFGHGVDSKEDYHRAFEPMAEAIRCCAKSPNAIGCRFRAIGPTEAEVKLDARGLLSEEAWLRGSDSSIPACVPPPSG